MHMGREPSATVGRMRTAVTLDPDVATLLEQLQRELGDRSWMVAPADRKRVMDARVDALWGNTLRSMGRDFAPLANFPEDPSLN